MKRFNSAWRRRSRKSPTRRCSISGAKFIFPALNFLSVLAQKPKRPAAFRGSCGFVYSCGDLGEMAFAAPRFKGW